MSLFALPDLSIAFRPLLFRSSTLAFGLMSLGQSVAHSQSTAAPEWRPISYANLQVPGPANQSFAGLWADEITRNNAFYRKRGDRRFLVSNAPVTEGHFVIRSPVKTVVLSVLNTATACRLVARDGPAGATLKRCPMRVAIYQQQGSSILNAGLGCFIEYTERAPGISQGPARNVAYAAYDKETQSIRTGLLFAGQPVDDCITRIPLPQG